MTTEPTPTLPKTQTFEIDGKTYEGMWRFSDHLTQDDRQFSFDRGRTWHSNIGTAFSHSAKANTLTRVGEEVTEGAEYETFVLSLLKKLADLDNGERLILTKTETQVVVIEEKIELAIRASTIKDVQLKLEG